LDNRIRPVSPTMPGYVVFRILKPSEHAPRYVELNITPTTSTCTAAMRRC